ncbi:restriction endonuclease subunit S [Paenarthrobacter nitroguajacolicus]|uniref:restriction endonuclease subunit S n=1 Tax=Paenarthrobacter nitroguajacolicus TaxID=211146 RepID=UPI003D217B8D
MTWPRVRLDDVASIQGGIQKQPKRAPVKHTFPFLRVANVTAKGLALDDVHTIELFDGELERYRLHPGDLLVVEGNGSPSQIGRAAIWDGSIPDSVHQNHLIRVRPGPNVDPRYLGLVWNSPLIRDELTAVSSSTSGLHTLSVGKLKRILLPLPPLEAQRRIVAILEDHLSRLDAAADYVSAASKRLFNLQESTLQATLAGHEVEYLPLSDLLAMRLTNGRSVPTSDDGFPVLRLTALTTHGVNLQERKSGAWTASEARRFLVSEGDFLVARGNGSIRLVGRGSLVRHRPDPVAFPDTIIRVRPNSDVLLGNYLDHVWNSRGTRRQIESMARTTAGIYKVNQKQLGRIQLPVPSSLDVQSAVAASANSSREAIDALDRSIKSATRHSRALRRAVLTAAFTGKLTGRHADNDIIEDLVRVPPRWSETAASS